MIQKLVDFALRMPFIILATATCLVIAGLTAYSRLDIEAYPNPVPPLVEVITQPDGWSAEEVERYVTVPLEIGLRQPDETAFKVEASCHAQSGARGPQTVLRLLPVSERGSVEDQLSALWY